MRVRTTTSRSRSGSPNCSRDCERICVRASNAQALAATTLSAADVTIDVGARRAWVGDDELDLRPKEFDLLVCLVNSPGQVVRREQIMSDVWDPHWWGSTKTLDIHMSALRRKLGERNGESGRITTLRGVGYRFEGR